MSKIEELDDSAKWIFTHIAGGSAKAVDDSLADLVKEYPHERRLEFVRRAVGDILREYGAAYRAEIEARRTLGAQLNSITEEQREQWEREREVEWIEARWVALKRSANIANRTFWITLTCFLIALIGDAWAFFIAHGDTYLRLFRDTVIGACILATVLGPFIMRAAWKDILATKTTLEKFVNWQKKNVQSVIKTDPDDAGAHAVGR
jgi:hypothetical protein